jgi:two-component system nitrogen regulation response regulator NtrX
MSYKILLADDDSGFRKSVMMMLDDGDYTLTESTTLQDAEHQLRAETFDLLLIDVHFGNNETSLQLIKKIQLENLDIPVVVLSGEASSTEAIFAIKSGAYDFIEKPVSFEKLKIAIENAITNSRLKRQIHSILHTSQDSVFVGESSSARMIKKQIDLYAQKDVKVLITGETGTGKEVVAQCIYKQSARSDRPFVTINVAAIPDNLIESELFGHTKGSFTGAVSEQMGKLEIAHRGTVFLDEIGDLSISAQNKLLRFLEADEIQKIGSRKVTKVDVRVIAATSSQLEEKVKLGLFRSDLYYRLNVARIEIPPLRDRPEDIPLLFNLFFHKTAQKYQVKSLPVLDDSALQALQRHLWPGNTRELRNIAERILLQDFEFVDDNIIRIFTKQELSKQKVDDEAFLPLKQWRAIKEKEYIERVLLSTNGSVTKAAEILDLDRTYLHQLIKKNMKNSDC